MNIIIIFSFLLLISSSISENTDNTDTLTEFTTGVKEGAITELIIELLVIILPIKLIAVILTLTLVIIIGYIIFDREFRQALYNYIFSYKGVGYITGCFLTQHITNTIHN